MRLGTLVRFTSRNRVQKLQLEGIKPWDRFLNEARSPSGQAFKWRPKVSQADSRTSLISISRSTKRHSIDERSAATSSSNIPESLGAYSNHVTRSKGSPKSRPCSSLRAIAGRYLSPFRICNDRASIISSRSSASRFHHSADFRMGRRAAHVAVLICEPNRRESGDGCSSRVKNLVFLASPRNTQDDLAGGRFARP